MITQAQALAVLRDVIEAQGGAIDAEVLAWVAAVAAERVTIGPWRRLGNFWCRLAAGEMVVHTWKIPAGWLFDFDGAHALRDDPPGGRGPYATRRAAMTAADAALRARGRWCDDRLPLADEATP